MTHFSDELRLGAAGILPDTRQTPGNLKGAPGVGTTPMVFYAINPATSTTTSLAALTVVSGTTVALSAGTSITATTVGGETAYQLDVPRAVAIWGTTGTTVTNITVQGWDTYQVPMTCTLSGPSGFTSVTTSKVFAYVKSVTAAGNTTSGVSVGTADVFGFPVRIDNFGDVHLTWSSAVVTASTGFTAAVTTDPATATTGDVRGKYAAQSAADGSKRLTAFIACPTVSTVARVYGVAQYSA